MAVAAVAVLGTAVEVRPVLAVVVAVELLT
jgi:hypothetical protein